MSGAALGRVILDVLQLAKLTGPDQQLPSGVHVRHGRTSSGRAMHYYLNCSSEAQLIIYPYGAGTELLTTAIVSGAKQTVGPWDLLIVEEGESPKTKP